jgi:hypothetical protein
MSTNFYFIPTEGPLVAFAELHLGKRSGGWQFSFQGYVEPGGKRRVQVSDSGLTVEVSIPPLNIRSYADWKDVLRSTPGRIHDENGVEYSFDEFEKEVASLAPGQRWGDSSPLLNHYDHVLEHQHRYGELDPTRNWKDAEGFSFSGYDFF